MRFWVINHQIDLDEVCAFSQLAEELGFTGVTWADHLVTPRDIDSVYPYAAGGALGWDPTTPFPDPFVMTAVVARETSTLRFMTRTLVLPLRDPFTVAKAITTTAVVSGNRFDLGVGVGWMREEFDLTGQDFADRGPRTDEMIEVVRKLSSGEMVDHEGEHYRFGPVQMRPAPTEPLRIFVGGHSRRALARAARNDGWLGVHEVNGEPTDVRATVDGLRKARAAAGTTDRPFEVVMALGAEAGADTYREMEDLGVTAIIFGPARDRDFRAGFESKRALLERFVESAFSAVSRVER